MPCNSTYVEPTRYETFSKRTAECLVYALAEMDRVIPRWVANVAENPYGDTNQVTELTVMLCDLCREIIDGGKADEIIYNGRIKRARDLADWWEEHEAADLEREQEEKQERLREQALNKLTFEEKEILGLLE